MPRTILFDLDGTLLLDRNTNGNSPVDQFIHYCGRLGHSRNGDAARRLERWQHEYWSKQHQVEADLAEHGKDKFWPAYNLKQLELLGVTGPLDDYASQIDNWFRDEYVSAPIVPADVRPTLAHLRDSGATLGLVSNRSHPLDTVAAEHGLADLFHFTLSAGEAGVWKPEPGIFHRALEMAAGQAASALYVGDNFYADILGARNAGLTPILIDRRNIFPDADCRVIKEIGELMEMREP
jgi:FMN phosphatase YigB (HAD superfamily)